MDAVIEQDTSSRNKRKIDSSIQDEMADERQNTKHRDKYDDAIQALKELQKSLEQKKHYLIMLDFDAEHPEWKRDPQFWRAFLKAKDQLPLLLLPY